MDKQNLKRIFILVRSIVIGVLLSRIFMAIFSYEITPLSEILNVGFLINVVIMSVGTAVSSLFFYSLLVDSQKSYTKRELLPRIFVHMLGIIAVVLVFAVVFGWVQLNDIEGVSVFVFIIVGVYVVVTILNNIHYRRLSKKINKKIIKNQQMKKSG